MKQLTTLTLLLIGLMWFSISVNAAKPMKKPSKQTAVSSGAYSTVKLSRSTNSVIVSLFNLGSASRVSYSLSYTANGVDQGAMGSIVVSGQTSDSRDLYLGTYSHGVCTPHYNIKNATLTVTIKSTRGSSSTKRYKIKV